jgi:hypothetical protein
MRALVIVLRALLLHLLCTAGEGLKMNNVCVQAVALPGPIGMAAVVLPLRIRAEPVANSRFGKCFLLPSVQADDNVCLVIQQGIVALACSLPAPASSALSAATGIDLSMMPPLLLAMPEHGSGKHDWMRWDNSKCDYVQETVRDPPLPPPSICSRTQAKAVIQGIHRYYSRQVLEPSIRGFLSILEKTFPRNDLYLFELLQNAVDDGAMKICFVASPNGQALMFRHNGRPFAALDCLGLASVGLSTKADGSRRTIGFMGIGFKAVYKRFAKVTVYNETWCFSFAKCAGATSAMEPLHAWVMKPIWSDAPPSAAASFRTQAPPSWCHFVLESPISGGSGGSGSVAGDMRSFPSAVPALLSRQSFANKKHRDATSLTPGNEVLAASSDSECWTLEWNDAVYRAHPPNGSMNLTFPRTSASRASGHSVWSGGCDCIRIVQEGGGSRAFERLWQFITLQFVPDTEAQAAYEAHTRRKWRESNSTEETCLFFQISSDGMVIDDASCRGTLHAVLPTKLKLPCGLNWQASWLLSVDRQDVQSVSDNAWNRCLLHQAPKLFACLVAWAAAAVGSKCKGCESVAVARTLECTYALLPPLTLGPEPSSSSTRRTLSCAILGQTLPMDALTDVLTREDVVPCHDSAGIAFLPGKDVLWLPPSLLQISPPILRSMFGIAAFAADLVGKSSWLSMWRASCVIPTESTLRTRRSQFKSTLCSTADVPAFVSLALKTLAALAAASQEQPHVSPAAPAVAADKGEIKEADALCGGWLPALRHWPVFPCSTASMANLLSPSDTNPHAQVSLCTASEMVWLSPEFAALPSDVRAILRVGASVAGRSILAQASGGPVQSAPLLHPALQEALDASSSGFRPSSGGSFSGSDDNSRCVMMANKCVTLAIECHPQLVISLESAAFHFFEAAAANQMQHQHGQDQSTFVSHCICLCKYAISVSKPRLMTHVLVEAPASASNTARQPAPSAAPASQPAVVAGRRKLMRAHACFVGAAYDKQDGNDIEALAEGLPAPFISQLYLTALDVSPKSLAIFFAAAGAQSGL